jgi:hypothetical protein
VFEKMRKTESKKGTGTIALSGPHLQIRFASTLQSAPKRNLAGRTYADHVGSGWRQIDVPASHKRSSIINAHDDASVVAYLNARTEWQCAMGCGQSSAIHPLAISCATTAKSI